MFAFDSQRCVPRKAREITTLMVDAFDLREYRASRRTLVKHLLRSRLVFSIGRYPGSSNRVQAVKSLLAPHTVSGSIWIPAATILHVRSPDYMQRSARKITALIVYASDLGGIVPFDTLSTPLTEIEGRIQYRYSGSPNRVGAVKLWLTPLLRSSLAFCLASL